MGPEAFPSPEDLPDYSSSIRDYAKITNRIKGIERRYGGAVSDPAVAAEIRLLDDELHQKHLRCIELGSRIGKNKSDVLIDILGEQEGLGEYNLPEFVVRTKDFLVEWKGFDQNDLTKLDENEVLLIFDYAHADEGGEFDYSEDHDERINRAKLLAERIGGKFVFAYGGMTPHEAVKVWGVAFPKDALEEVTRIIRDDPKEFRLGKEFYK